MARPELSERNATWPVSLRLEPLGDDDVEQLITRSLPEQLRERIARTAGGNPLFIEEMLAMAGESDGDVVVPPTLQALLAARLDQLEPAERSVLERGAIEGEIFHRGAVQALSPEESQVTPRLVGLIRKELIKPDKPQIAGEDGFRFRHLLLRDSAYEGLPKATRADLHERFATWLGQHGTELVEQDELLGYHLERAWTYRRELGLPDDGTLAAAARRCLTAGGSRAALRQDYRAASSLFERAAALMPPPELDLALEIELGHALFWAGNADEALRRADATVERASAAGDRVGELCGRIMAGVLRLDLDPESAGEKLAALAGEALPVFEAAGDDLALYVAYSALSEEPGQRGQWDTSLETYEQAVVHYARRAGRLPSGTLGMRAACRFFGTTPLSVLLTWLDENEPPAGRDHFLRAYRAGTLAMLGRFDEARATLAETRAELAERGAGVLLANITSFESVWVELWAGDPATAAEFGARGWNLYLELGEHSFLPAAAGVLAQVSYARDRLDEAEAWVVRAAERGTRELAEKETVWRQVKAKVLARRGEHAEAERIAREAIAISDQSEMLSLQGDVYADFAEVLQLAGKPDDAVAALARAVERYERKENLVMAERTRERLAALTPTP
jgi:tetratricopeptide (TPR) repeat protein